MEYLGSYKHQRGSRDKKKVETKAEIAIINQDI